MNKILVLQGVPASGKSTFAREFIKNKKDWVIVSRDSIRDSRGDYWVPCQENYISDVEEFQITAAINRKLNVIIDATNLNPKTINKWNELSKKLNCEIEYKEFEIGYKEALKRDSNRKRPVGTKTMKQFFRNYFPKLLYEGTGSVDDRKILENDFTKSICIICDIDGTIALKTGRSPYDYSKVNEDKCDPRMKNLFRLFDGYQNYHIGHLKVFFLSGREGTEECQQLTKDWLIDNFPYLNHELIMRKKGDHRKDSIVKKELYEEHIKDQYEVLCVFDDRNQVVDMWREEGLLCCQVYYGDF